VNSSHKGKIIGVLLIVVFILGSTLLLGFVMSASQNTMNKETVTSRISNDYPEDNENGIPDFPANEHGQSYGSGGYGPSNPDLILATGIDGTMGYVLREDLEGTGPLTMPTNPKEALEYMEALEALAAEARERGDAYIYTIPLYAEDGRTIISEFGISFSVLDINPPDDELDELIVPDISNGGDYTPGIHAVAITYAGRARTDITLGEGESFRLQVRYGSAANDDAIVWTSSDRNVFDVVVVNADGTEVMVTGMGRGVAVLTVSVGGVEAECIVRVREIR
jgi:hypothetical protein